MVDFVKICKPYEPDVLKAAKKLGKRQYCMLKAFKNRDNYEDCVELSTESAAIGYEMNYLRVEGGLTFSNRYAVSMNPPNYNPTTDICEGLFKKGMLERVKIKHLWKITRYGYDVITTWKESDEIRGDKFHPMVIREKELKEGKYEQ